MCQFYASYRIVYSSITLMHSRYRFSTVSVISLLQDIIILLYFLLAYIMYSLIFTFFINITSCVVGGTALPQG